MENSTLEMTRNEHFNGLHSPQIDGPSADCRFCQSGHLVTFALIEGDPQERAVKVVRNPATGVDTVEVVDDFGTPVFGLDASVVKGKVNWPENSHTGSDPATTRLFMRVLERAAALASEQAR